MRVYFFFILYWQQWLRGDNIFYRFVGFNFVRSGIYCLSVFVFSLGFRFKGRRYLMYFWILVQRRQGVQCVEERTLSVIIQFGFDRFLVMVVLQLKRVRWWGFFVIFWESFVGGFLGSQGFRGGGQQQSLRCYFGMLENQEGFLLIFRGGRGWGFIYYFF